MIGYDRFLSGCCPKCNVKMIVQPKTIIGGKSSKKKRFAYDNYECPKCGEKFSRLVQDDIPVGNA